MLNSGNSRNSEDSSEGSESSNVQEAEKCGVMRSQDLCSEPGRTQLQLLRSCTMPLTHWVFLISKGVD